MGEGHLKQDDCQSRGQEGSRQVSHAAKECYLADLIILIVAETEETHL